MREEDNTRDEDRDGDENEKECPRFVRVDFIVEDERVEESRYC